MTRWYNIILCQPYVTKMFCPKSFLCRCRWCFVANTNANSPLRRPSNFFKIYIISWMKTLCILFFATELPLDPESDEFRTIKAWICQARSLSGSGFMGIFPGILNNSKVEEIWRHEEWLVSDMNTVYLIEYAHGLAVLWFVVLILSIHSGFMWCIYPYPSRLLHWHRGNHMIAPVPMK